MVARNTSGSNPQFSRARACHFESAKTVGGAVKSDEKSAALEPSQESSIAASAALEWWVHHEIWMCGRSSSAADAALTRRDIETRGARKKRSHLWLPSDAAPRQFARIIAKV
jgi:hypothetical protein